MTNQEINTNPDIRQIILSRGKVTIVDVNDYDWLSQWKWHMCHDYAVRNIRIASGRKLIYLHKFILDASNNTEVDHVSRDTLDNRRCNLRLATRSQNQINTRKIIGTTSKYKGVSWKTSNRKWVAQIQSNKKKIFIGYFDYETQAALAYNNKAKEFFGDFVKPNIIT